VNAILNLVDLNKKAGQWIVLSFLALIWGSSFILMKKGLESFSFDQVAGLRIFISFIFLLPFALKRLSKVKKAHLKSLIVVGFFGNAIPAFLFTKAETQVSSSMAGILNALTPLFALIAGLLIYKVKFTWQNLSGVFLGLTGAAVLVISKYGFGLSAQNIFPLLIVLATLLYSFSVNEIKQKLSGLDGLTIIAVAFLFVGPIAGIYLLNTDFAPAFKTPGFIPNLSCIIILAIFGSAIANFMFNYLVFYTNALFATSVTYLIPVVAIFWGLLDSESLLLSQLPAIVLILVGIYLVNKKRTSV
jgi:drug/metabolite transporter (DMT)-like permease